MKPEFITGFSEIERFVKKTHYTVITDKSGPKMYKLFSPPFDEKIASILLNLESS